MGLGGSRACPENTVHNYAFSSWTSVTDAAHVILTTSEGVGYPYVTVHAPGTGTSEADA